MIALSIICGVELLLIVLALRSNWKIAKERNKFRRESKKANNEAIGLKKEVDHLNIELRIAETKNKKLCDDLAFLKFIFAFIPGDILGGPIRIRRRDSERF